MRREWLVHFLLIYQQWWFFRITLGDCYKRTHLFLELTLTENGYSSYTLILTLTEANKRSFIVSHISARQAPSGYWKQTLLLFVWWEGWEQNQTYYLFCCKTLKYNSTFASFAKFASHLVVFISTQRCKINEMLIKFFALLFLPSINEFFHLLIF